MSSKYMEVSNRRLSFTVNGHMTIIFGRKRPMCEFSLTSKANTYGFIIHKWPLPKTK
jgi:hypothetical protein